MKRKRQADAGERVGNTQNSSVVSRSYQIEMFEESLQGNAIVVVCQPEAFLSTHALNRYRWTRAAGKHMCTKGFTILTEDKADSHSAILRIMHELEHGDYRKLVWFLAPTVTLCQQQYHTLRASFPAVYTRLIVGSDNVDCWETQDIWDKVLKDQRIVVTTHAILSDALSHGFVVMQRLALLIYDEAHHCIRKHPANKIMKDHYYPCLERHGKDSVPAVLGLTASPVMSASSRLKGLQQIESNLDSKTKTPRLHREELRKFVHLPNLLQLQFTPEIGPETPMTLKILCATVQNLDISQDPIVVQLMANPMAKANLQKVLLSKRTRNQEALHRFCSTAKHVATQLGAWATDLFISHAAAKLEQAVTMRRDIMFGWDDKDQDYLHSILRMVCDHPDVSSDMNENALKVSGKVHELLRFLSSLRNSTFSGIIFVEQRAIAALLCKILTVHTTTRHLSSATFVGTSNSFKRQATIGDLADAALQDQVLDEFRIGTCNLIVATSVLEEGIDISSCNLVVCFDRPANLKSFVQRRGRARDRESTFVMMVAGNDVLTKKTDWQALEEQMIRAYQEERKALETVLKLEDSAENGNRRFEIESTNAVLTYEIAVQHLNHFCNVLPKVDHVENRPIFIFHEQPITGFVQAEVILPNSVDPSVRRTLGRQYWKSERQAKKDASFEAYLALYRAELVNDHLLPAPVLTKASEFKVEERATMVSISPCSNPLVQIANDWVNASEDELHAVVITVERPTETDLQMLLILPQNVPAIADCNLYWDSETQYHATFMKKPLRDIGFDRESLECYRDANDLILGSIRQQKLASNQGDNVLLFAPLVENLARWLIANSGTLNASDVKSSGQLAIATSIVRSPSFFNAPLLFDSWTEEDGLKATTIPRRRNFLAQEFSKVSNKSNYQQVQVTKSHILPVQNTTFDLIDSEAVIFSLLIPSIEHHIAQAWLSSKFCSELLAEVGFGDTGLVLEAISAASANNSVNYQRLELIGDSTLKFVVAIQLFATKPKWHEGYLSAAKDCIVANSRLARAALCEGVDRYIITEPFSPRKWRPKFVHDLIKQGEGSPRKISTKVLADVVEALIGAALMDGGVPNAVKCIHRFLPEVNSQTPRELLQPLLRCLESRKDCLLPHLAQVEALLAYKFRNPSLLTESLTHPSLATDFSTPSYQRLEYLGDAVLDMLIVRKFALKSCPWLSHVQMHLIKSAMVNAEFLAFLCMEMADERETTDTVTTNDPSVKGEAKVRFVKQKTRVALHEFLRFSPTAMSLVWERQACLHRYESLAPRIRPAIETSTQYPWALLSQLNAPKFLSDIVEALIGAVFVDSLGDLDACAQLAGRFGITQYLERIIKDNIDVLHPKSRLGELVGREDGKEEKRSNKVKYIIQKENEGNVGYRCRVSVAQVVFDEIRGGLTRDEVTTRAADVAVQALLKE